MTEALSKSLFEHGGVIAWAAFLVPGFIAWRVMQARRPQGEQKATDAIVTIGTFSVIVMVLWYGDQWTAPPSNWYDALRFLIQIVGTPIMLALIVEAIIDYSADHGWITSPHPRAWDFLWNELALNQNKYEIRGLFMIVTLKAGGKIAGVYGAPGYVSLWPYDRDLFLGKVWQLDEAQETPLREVTGSVGIYIDYDEIRSIELLDYGTVLEAAIAKAEAPQDGVVDADFRAVNEPITANE